MRVQVAGTLAFLASLSGIAPGAEPKQTAIQDQQIKAKFKAAQIVPVLWRKKDTLSGVFAEKDGKLYQVFVERKNPRFYFQTMDKKVHWVTSKKTGASFPLFYLGTDGKRVPIMDDELVGESDTKRVDLKGLDRSEKFTLVRGGVDEGDVVLVHWGRRYYCPGYYIAPPCWGGSWSYYRSSYTSSYASFGGYYNPYFGGGYAGGSYFGATSTFYNSGYSNPYPYGGYGGAVPYGAGYGPFYGGYGGYSQATTYGNSGFYGGYGGGAGMYNPYNGYGAGLVVNPYAS